MPERSYVSDVTSLLVRHNLRFVAHGRHMARRRDFRRISEKELSPPSRTCKAMQRWDFSRRDCNRFIPHSFPRVSPTLNICVFAYNEVNLCESRNEKRAKSCCH